MKLQFHNLYNQALVLIMSQVYPEGYTAWSSEIFKTEQHDWVLPQILKFILVVLGKRFLCPNYISGFYLWK